MVENIWIAGVGMTPFGLHSEMSVKDLVRAAVSSALTDAQASVGDVPAAYFGNTTQASLEGQLMVSGQIALREMGFQGIPVVNVENACATGATAMHQAVNHVRAGVGDVALAVGVEKMNVGTMEERMSLFDGAHDVSEPEALERTMLSMGGGQAESGEGQRSIFMDIYAAMARNHMRVYGTTQEQVAAVSSKNHAHAVDNPRAHFREEMSVEQILTARPLSFPLTVPMCSPITDGAAAVVICNDTGLRRLESEAPVRVLASVLGTGTDRDTTNFDGHISRLVADRAYLEAGIGPDEVSIAEVHDATAFAEILQTEMLRLVPDGEGGPAALAGDTSIGGRIPVNTSGGLESKGHPIGATGLGQIFELVDQLRGTAGRRQVDGARIGLAENGGGFHRGEEAVASVIILGGK